MNDNCWLVAPPPTPIVGFYALSTGIPPPRDPRFVSHTVSCVQLAMYKKPCWFHRTMMWLCFNIVLRENKP